MNATYPYYLGRLIGGLLVFSGMLIMAVNVIRTWQASKGVVEHAVLTPDVAEARA